jgi:hypothetical protein
MSKAQVEELIRLDSWFGSCGKMNEFNTKGTIPTISECTMLRSHHRHLSPEHSHNPRLKLWPH